MGFRDMPQASTCHLDRISPIVGSKHTSVGTQRIPCNCSNCSIVELPTREEIVGSVKSKNLWSDVTRQDVGYEGVVMYVKLCRCSCSDASSLCSEFASLRYSFHHKIRELVCISISISSHLASFQPLRQPSPTLSLAVRRLHCKCSSMLLFPSTSCSSFPPLTGNSALDTSTGATI